EVRLRVDVTRDGGVGVVPAGTVGVVVDDVHAPGQYAVDVEVDGEPDNVAVGGEQIELVAATA
ncbi:MAG: hypothetical protein J2P24_16820, partial [Streptosporangiales bacterium]|nr:hypothetical protein [Streptosporangiales bacterium]